MVSKQGDAIAAALHRLDHPTADEVFMEVRKEHPRVSLATVYRNLDNLVDRGEARLRRVGTMKRYDATVEPHAHLHCNQCDSLIDLEYSEEDLARLRQEAARLGFKVEDRIVEIQGTCAGCQAQPAEPLHA